MEPVPERFKVPPPYDSRKFVKTEDFWNAVFPGIAALNESLFHNEIFVDAKPDNPLLGDRINGEDVIAYQSIKDAFLDPHSAARVLINPADQSVVGYTMAMPRSRFNPTVLNDKEAYLYITGIQEKEQGKGYVQHLVDPLIQDLADMGYETFVRDAMVDNGYAATIKKRFAGAIVGVPVLHNRFGLGNQEEIVIDIPKYLQKIKL